MASELSGLPAVLGPKCKREQRYVAVDAGRVSVYVDFCTSMIDRIGFTLISAAIAITVIAFARNKTGDFNAAQVSKVDIPGRSSRRSTQSLIGNDSRDRNSVLISAADPLVLQAGEAIRLAFNAQRATACPSISPYSTRGAIQYAKKAAETNGTFLYTLEIVFGGEAVYARVMMIPKNPSAKFRLVFSIPGPCEVGVEEQLAVSANVVNRINTQNLSWTASLNTAYEGVQIKRFGLGLNSLSNEVKQAYLISLMASKSTRSTPAAADAQAEQRRAAPAPLATHGTTASPIGPPALLHTSTMEPPPADPSHSPPIVAALPRPAETEARGQGDNNATAARISAHTAVPLPASSRRRAVHTQPTLRAAVPAPPPAFDARDIYAGQVPCKAYTALDQGGCGACYAFASASAFSARVCRADPAASVRNVVVSPQSLLDCASGGCSGGDPVSTLASLVDRPAVEIWCDPYTGGPQACGSNCGASNTYGALAGSVRQVGGAGADGVLQMQLELVRGGPGVVGLMAMSDLFSYASGVYSPSASAQPVGGHAVSLVGWGVDQGVPYWLCQNSWGEGWGEQGFFRIVRGADACRIESMAGLVVAQPLVAPLCPASDCSYLSATRKDCSCQCPYGRTGPTCKTCALSCQNGGARAADCSACECRMGYAGTECEGGYRLSSRASCGASAAITVDYGFAATVPPPTQNSFVGIFSMGEVSPTSFLTMAYVCAATYPSYNQAVNGGLCPSSGSFQLSPPTAPGQYKVVVVPWSPMNAFGQQGYYNLQDSNIIGLYTVLPPGCSADSRAAAQLANDPGTLLANRLAAASTTEAAQLAAMKARLDAVQPLLAALLAEKPASLTITNLNAAAPVVWMGVPGQICFSIPPSANVNPKGLVLYIGDGAGGSYYPDALGPAGNAPMPPGPEGCSEFTLSPGVAKGRYTIALEDSATGHPFATVSFAGDMASVSLATYNLDASAVFPTIAWSIPAARASPRDMVRVYDRQGAVAYWFYTSCNCRSAPGPAPVPAGTMTFKVTKDPKVSRAGPYTIKLHPGGRAAVAAVNTDWIPWGSFGW